MGFRRQALTRGDWRERERDRPSRRKIDPGADQPSRPCLPWFRHRQRGFLKLPPTSTSRCGGPRLLRPAFLALCWIAGSHLLPGETAAAQGICDRTPQVRDEILRKVGIDFRNRGGTDWPTDCAEVAADHLALVRSLWLVRDNITAFQAHDFRGLVSLKSITLAGNPLLTTFPAGIFQGLSRLERPAIVRELPDHPARRTLSGTGGTLKYKPGRELSDVLSRRHLPRAGQTGIGWILATTC